MEKTCIICGRPLDGEAARCPHCGSNQAVTLKTPATEIPPSEEPTATAEVLAEASPEEEAAPMFRFAAVAAFLKGLPKKVYVLGAVALAVIIFWAVVLANLPLSGPERAVADYTAVRNGDFSNIEKMWPDAYWQLMGNGTKDKDALVAEIRDNLSKNMDWERLHFGSDYSLTLQILEEEPVDKETMKTIRTGLALYKIPNQAVTAARNLTVWQTAQGDTQIQDDILRLTAVKIGKSWYLVSVRNYATMPVSFFFKNSYTTGLDDAILEPLVNN